MQYSVTTEGFLYARDKHFAVSLATPVALPTPQAFLIRNQATLTKLYIFPSTCTGLCRALGT